MGSVNSYYNITIQDGKYQIHKAAAKPQGEHALDLLKKIQSILKHKMVFDKEHSDPEFKPEQAPQLLGIIAKDVHQGYSEKLQKVNFFTRLFFGKEKTLRRVHKDIENYLHPRSLGLNPDMMGVLSQLLPEKKILALRLVNRESANSPELNHTIIERAKSYGYEGESMQGAKEYIQNLYKGLKVFRKNVKCFTPNFNFSVYGEDDTDYPGMLAKIKNLKDDELMIFVKQFGNLLVWRIANDEMCVFFRNCIKPNQIKEVKDTNIAPEVLDIAIRTNSTDMVKFVLETGFQPDSSWQVKIFLFDLAIGLKNAEIVNLLLDHGVKVINQHYGDYYGQYKQPYLIAAIQNCWDKSENSYAIVKSLLEHGASVEALSIQGLPAWHFAKGDQKIIELLNEYKKNA